MNFESVLILGLVVYYLVEVLQYEQKSSHHGPFPDKKRVVVHVQRNGDAITNYTHPVTVFDWLRRLFRAYNVVQDEGDESETWFVRNAAMEVWECPVCLSFWVAAIVCCTYGYLYEYAVVPTVMLHLATAAVSTVIHIVLMKLSLSPTIALEQPTVNIHD